MTQNYISQVLEATAGSKNTRKLVNDWESSDTLISGYQIEGGRTTIELVDPERSRKTIYQICQTGQVLKDSQIKPQRGLVENTSSVCPSLPTSDPKLEELCGIIHESVNHIVTAIHPIIKTNNLQRYGHK